MSIHRSLMQAVEDATEAAAWYRRALGATELWSQGSVVGLKVGEATFLSPSGTLSSGGTGRGADRFLDLP